ncbi:beta-glucosidase [Penicillium macrosclerotiorum]|uniref:beta-glucosidase n=1 Tax=Penicillium macrosclerotiorum TaxID=303699 RepID=UPI002547E29D|nr:beta-glucosidase [Penicillium macrosclerotiorum]KAJ5676261.1 beta-glucosidase [Penicillium macrosclerotiorum]
MLVPFKAAVQLGGVKGVMMAYSEFDDVPCSLNPVLYDALNDWGFDAQWHNAGGMVQFYDFSLDQYVRATLELVSNGTLSRETLEKLASRILGVKYDLGLFKNPFIPESIDSKEITASHVPLTLESAQKSIVLLENRNNTLPLNLGEQNIQKIALIGPFGDTFNFGDYSGQWGGYPVKNASTIRQGISQYLASHFPSTKLVTAWGANSWEFNGQYNVPPYLLSTNGTNGGLLATYYADTNFSDPRYQKVETPSLDWGLYPPERLPSNNFSVSWEGKISVPVDIVTDGWLGVAVYANTSARLYIDRQLLLEVKPTTGGNILSDIPGTAYTTENATTAPPGSVPFLFQPAAVHDIRLEYQAWNYVQKVENVNSLNAQVLLFWNLVDRTNSVRKSKAVKVAEDADVVILAVGANWNSDGESGDRATLELSPNQTILADAIFALDKPVILVLQGGRPFAIPEYYKKSAAVLNTFFPGQSGGQAISDILFGVANPGGRVPISVPFNVGTLPAFYNYKPSFPRDYTDIPYKSLYPFGYGLSFANFSIANFQASANTSVNADSHITNLGPFDGSYVPQVYLLGRVSSITRPERQLVAFSRVYLAVGETRTVHMELDVSRYLVILDRAYKWTVELGEYNFALLENGGSTADSSMNVTMTCTG